MFFFQPRKNGSFGGEFVSIFHILHKSIILFCDMILSSFSSLNTRKSLNVISCSWQLLSLLFHSYLHKNQSSCRSYRPSALPVPARQVIQTAVSCSVISCSRFQTNLELTIKFTPFVCCHYY